MTANRIHDASRPITRRGWLRPSTRAFLEEARRTEGASWLDIVHGYVYSRWPYLYIGLANGEHWLVRWTRPLRHLLGSWAPAARNRDERRSRAADGYHGKVVTPEGARQLVTVQQDVRLQDLEQIIPYRQARDIVLHDPDHIVVIECPCRASRAEPCSPLDVCLVVGEPFAAFIAEHHPRRARWIDAEEACDILEAAHRRGDVHHAFFNEPMLGRFFGICNCCSCCCTAIQLVRQGTPMLAPSGYCSEVASDACSACGDCVQSCPFGAIEWVGAVAEADRQRCMGCGVCVSLCPTGARSLVRDPARGVPLEIQSLIAQAQSSHSPSVTI